MVRVLRAELAVNHAPNCGAMICKLQFPHDGVPHEFGECTCARVVRSMAEIRRALNEGAPFTLPEDMDPKTAWELGVESGELLRRAKRRR